MTKGIPLKPDQFGSTKGGDNRPNRVFCGLKVTEATPNPRFKYFGKDGIPTGMVFERGWRKRKTMQTNIKSLSCILNISAIFALAFFVACGDVEDVRPGERITEQDRIFARDAAYSNSANLAFGQLPVTKSADEMIITYGQEIATAYMDANTRLKEITETRQIDIPDAMNAEMQAEHQRLLALEGLDFDSTFLASQLAAHREARDSYQNQVDKGSNDALRNYAFQFLPDIILQLDQVLVLLSDRFPGDN